MEFIGLVQGEALHCVSGQQPEHAMHCVSGLQPALARGCDLFGGNYMLWCWEDQRVT